MTEQQAAQLDASFLYEWKGANDAALRLAVQHVENPDEEIRKQYLAQIGKAKVWEEARRLLKAARTGAMG